MTTRHDPGGYAGDSEDRSVFVNSLDEALKTKPVGRKPRGKRRIEDIARRRLQDAEKMAREQRKVIRSGKGHDDPSFVKAFNETTKTMTNLLAEIRQAHEAERKAFGGLTQDQLDQVFVAQLARIASKLEADDWRALLAVGWGDAIAEMLVRQFEQPAEVPA